jgi:hypothetical protein
MEDRPADLSIKQLRFQRQTPVRWLSTRVLSGTALRLLLARVLGGYLDKRELQAINEQGVFEHCDSDEKWIDYVADIGDGFDATYSVAYLESQPELDVGQKLPRGDILIMGGDQVYPSANWRDYENRCKGPYQAALPDGDQALYAIPGNHDWFDGLTTFLRLFGAGRKLGGRQTRQWRSYWAARLPHRWWLIGIDAEFDAYLDAPQLQYFTEALTEMEPGDTVVLCVPRPSWIWTDADPRDYDRIDYFIRMFITPKGGRVPLILTGDRHHYVHYRESDGPRHLVTAGGGGAYLSATHTLPDTLIAPPPDSMARHGSPVRQYDRGASFPSRRQSWSQALGVFTRLPLRNPSFVALLGGIHLLGLLAFLASTGTAVAASVVTLGINLAFANPSAGSRTAKHWFAGAAHAAVHLSLTALGTALWRLWDLTGWESYLAYVPVSGLVACVITSVYLLIAGSFGINDNELFAGQSIDDYKCFLRMRLDEAGLTVFPIAVTKVGRRWKANPRGEPGSAWIVPARPIKYRLIEQPYLIPKNSATGSIADGFPTAP